MNVSLVALDGAILTELFTAFVLGTVRWNPRIWLQDFPPDIQAAVPPKTRDERRLTALLAAPFLTVILGGLVLTASRFGTGGGFTATALHTYLVWQCFNLFDLVVIDWLGMRLLVDPEHPPFPGTEGFAGYRDDLFHFIGFLKGSVMGIPVALAAAGIAWSLMA